jgi:aspartyl-tRNA(Asn)/glutamyl-tRNA(Gln) amidotransferase subunit A
MIKPQLHTATVIELANAFRTGRSTPSKQVKLLLERIDSTKTDNIFINVSVERALAEANAADRRFENGSPLSWLDGVPIVWKDVFDMAGMVTTAGSAVLSEGANALVDALGVQRLAASGMVSLGKVNTSEFAYSGLGLNPHFGTPRNPHDQMTHRSPGGSSSGSGTAVAAGLAPCAIGTDTGGSVRVPASFNGIVGFKPTVGLIETTGMFTLSRSFDTVGTLAHTVEDCALLFQALRGALEPQIKRLPLQELELVSPRNIVTEDLEPAVAENYERSIDVLCRQGVKVRREHVDALSEMIEVTEMHGNLVAAEAYVEHRRIIQRDRKKIDRRVIHRIEGGACMSGHDVILIQRRRAELSAKLRMQLGGAILMMPTTPNVAPPIAELDADDALFHEVNRRSLRNVSLGNMLSLCGVAMPNGHDKNGLPTSILFSAPGGHDERLLGLCMIVESVLKRALSAKTGH